MHSVLNTVFTTQDKQFHNYYHLQATVRRKLFYALFNAQNVHVWQAKHARLAGETCTLTAKLREAFLFQAPNSFGIFLISFAILKNPFANPLKKVANLLMEFAMFLS